MSSQCQACGGKVADAFICRNCQGELRKNLDDLPWWVDRLAESAIGQTNLGDGGRRTRSEPAGLMQYTDESVATDELGYRCGTRGQQRLERDLVAGNLHLDRVLSAGRVNPRAARLLSAVQNSLTTIVRDICESRGVPLRNVRGYPPSFIGPLPDGSIRCDHPRGAGFCAQWLAQAVSAVALDESAGQVHHEITGHMREIERAVNRAVPPKFCGPCPSLVIDKDTGRERECGMRLMAKATATVVWCPTCKHEHDIERIINRLLANVEHWRFTREELIGSRTGDWAGIMGLLDEPVKKSAFYQWCKDGLLKVAGYRRPDGGNGISRRTDEDVPIYRLSQVRKLRITQGENRERGTDGRFGSLARA